MLIEIAKVDPHHGLFAAKEAALTLRLGLKSQYDKDLLLYKIVKIEAKHDLYSAKITAQNIEDTRTKTLALLEIAQLDPKHDFTDVKASALSINYSPAKEEVFVKIIKEEAKYDLTEAKKTLAMTGNNDKAILEIVKVEARYSYNDAKSRALTIQRQLFKTEAFLELAKLQPSANIIKFVKDSALYARVFSIDEVNILLEITKLDPYHDFTDIKWAVMALYPHWIFQSHTEFSQALLNIVKEEARYDFVAAKTTALTIILNDFKALALLKIAKTAQKQLEGR